MSRGDAAKTPMRTGSGSLGRREQRAHGKAQSPAEAPAARLGLTRVAGRNHVDCKLRSVISGTEAAFAPSRARVLRCGLHGNAAHG